MITFKQFLAEAANYPLYHGTTLGGLVHILIDNKMVAKNLDSHSKHPFAYKETISMSRSKKFASYWSKRVDYYSTYDTPTDTIVIEFDREKLSRNYKILPYNHFPHKGTRPNRWLGYGTPRKGEEYKSIDSNQYEERVSAPINNVLKYINKIYISKQALEKFKEFRPEEYQLVKKKIVVQ